MSASCFGSDGRCRTSHDDAPNDLGVRLLSSGRFCSLAKLYPQNRPPKESSSSKLHGLVPGLSINAIALFEHPINGAQEAFAALNSALLSHHPHNPLVLALSFRPLISQTSPEPMRSSRGLHAPKLTLQAFPPTQLCWLSAATFTKFLCCSLFPRPCIFVLAPASLTAVRLPLAPIEVVLDDLAARSSRSAPNTSLAQ